jgi:hypothetical protein
VPLRQDLAEFGLAHHSVTADPGPSRGNNTTNGSIGWATDTHPVVILVDTGSDLSFISRQVFARLSREYKVRTISPPVTVRLTNGERTSCSEKVTIGLDISGFKTPTELYILDWDSYDVLLGMDWLKLHEAHWDLSTSKVTLRNGRGTSTCVRLRPFRHLDDDRAAELDLHFIGYKEARKELRRHEKYRSQLDTSSYKGPPETTSTRKPEKDTPKKDKIPPPPPSQLPPPTLVLLRDSREEDSQSLSSWIGQIPRRFRNTVQQFRDRFREELPTQYPRKREVKHDIETNDAKPINLPYYGLSTVHREEQNRQIKELLEKGIIRPSNSPWGFPVLFVPKPDGKWRMCIDYRLLNNVTTKDAYPLPRIQDCLDDIGSATILSKIDLTSGYWQIEMGIMSIPKTAFNTRMGKYEFLAMPFGLTNAPATFQRIMNDAMRDFVHRFVVVYLDDIVIYSHSEKEHEDHLRQVLEKLREVDLFARPSKCIFGVKELEFCGHVVGKGTCKPSPTKIKIILEWPQPRNVHEVRQFLGLASYYRRYIRDFAKITACLSDLLIETDADLRKKKYRPIRWNASCSLAFEHLKRAMASSPILIQLDDSRPFQVETDCSEWALGCVLLQLGADGKLHPVAYDGRKLQGAELNYPIHEKELLAIKHALRIWSIHLQNGRKTLVLTDHESLRYLQSTKTPSKRLARWISEFSEYDLDIRYRKGSEAIVPDALSRRPDFLGKGPATRAWTVDTNTLNAILAGKPITCWEDAMLQYLESNTLKDVDESFRDSVKDTPELETFQKVHNRLYKLIDSRYVPFIPKQHRKDFIRYYHDHYGHFSGRVMLGACIYRGWWPRQEQDLAQYSQRCDTCARTQRVRKRHEQPHHQVNPSIRPFEKWGIDFVGPLIETPHGNKWILTAIDYATNWPIAKAVPEATDEVVSDFLFDLYINYGAFRELLSDNGSNLNAKQVEYFLNRVRIKHRNTTPYHPQTNGKCERLNGILGDQLTKLLVNHDVKEWDEMLSTALFNCRIKAHHFTKMSPFKLVYGLEPRLTGDKEDFDLENLDADFETRFKALHTARHEANRLLLQRAIYSNKLRSEKMPKNSSTLEPNVGDWVMLENPARYKFNCTYFGPFKVLKKSWLGTYTIGTIDDKLVFRRLVHGSRIRKYLGDTREAWEVGVQAAKQVNQDRGMEDYPLDETILEILATEDEKRRPTYSDLMMMSKKDWEQRERSGDRSIHIGEGIGAALTTSSRKRRQSAKIRKAATLMKAIPASVSVSPSTDRPLLPDTASVPSTTSIPPSIRVEEPKEAPQQSLQQDQARESLDIAGDTIVLDPVGDEQSPHLSKDESVRPPFTQREDSKASESSVDARAEKGKVSTPASLSTPTPRARGRAEAPPWPARRIGRPSSRPKLASPSKRTSPVLPKHRRRSSPQEARAKSPSMPSVPRARAVPGRSLRPNPAAKVRKNWE